MKKLYEMFFRKEFVLFLIIGIVNTFNGTLFSFLFSYLYNANIAFIIGYLCGLIIAYLLNSYIVFHKTLSLSRFWRFAISYIPNFLIQNILVFFIYNQWHYDKMIAYVSAAVIGIPITFLLLKVFAFQKQ